MLNWLARYAPAGTAILDGDGRATESILDVGCGPHGFACAHPDVPFVGLDVEFPHAVAPSMTAIQAPPGALPFVDGAFDTVLSLDTLEHLPRAERARFVADLARVAARRVLLACPTAEAAGIDAAVRARYEAGGVPVPTWLSEHDEHGLPAREEIDAFVADVPGFRARPWPMANGVLAALLAWGDLFEFGREAAREVAQHRAEWVRLLEGASFGPSFRGGWLLERAEPVAPRVGLARLADDTVGALRCLRCGGGHERPDGGSALRCTSCGARVQRTPEGAWKLTAPRTELLLAPEWAEPASWLPVLGAYIGEAGDAATLYLDAATTALPTEAVFELVQTACTELSGGQPFADVVLLASGEAAPGATPVRTADDVSAALA